MSHLHPPVEVRLLSASKVPVMDFLGKADPYVIVKWGGTEIGRTSVVKQSLEPVWGSGDTFELDCTAVRGGGRLCAGGGWRALTSVDSRPAHRCRSFILLNVSSQQRR